MTTTPKQPSESTLYLIEYPIGGKRYSARLAASSWEHAERLATALGGKVLGDNVHEVSAVNPHELMEFIRTELVTTPFGWHANAEEQLQAFLTLGRPIQPEESI